MVALVIAHVVITCVSSGIILHERLDDFLGLRITNAPNLFDGALLIEHLADHLLIVRGHSKDYGITVSRFQSLLLLDQVDTVLHGSRNTNHHSCRLNSIRRGCESTIINGGGTVQTASSPALVQCIQAPRIRQLEQELRSSWKAVWKDQKGRFEMFGSYLHQLTHVQRQYPKEMSSRAKALSLLFGF